MTTILHIDASARGERSLTRRLSKTFVDAWVERKPSTFDLARGDYPLEPVMSGKTLVILSARGEFGFGPGGLRENMNHLETHIRTCAHYLGVEDSHLIAIDYQEFGDTRYERSVADAYAAIPILVEQLAGTVGLDKMPAE